MTRRRRAGVKIGPGYIDALGALARGCMGLSTSAEVVLANARRLALAPPRSRS
jgi:hypothetical protein